MTDDLYYIRSGKNYGFLPKKHLRETTRGNYPFQVEIDISSKRIDQQVREQNFLFEFLKSSQPEIEVNETETLSAPLNEPSVEKFISNEIPTEIPLDVTTEAPALATTETSNEIKSETEVTQPTTESDEDSGIDEGDDDEDEEDDEGDSVDEVTEKPAEIVLEKKIEPEQPELIAIPPNKDPESAKIVETFIEVTKEEMKPSDEVLKVVKPSTEEIEAIPPSVTRDEFIKQTNISETEVFEEKVPEFIPINKETVKEASDLIKPSNETTNTTTQQLNESSQEKSVQEEIKTDEIIASSEEKVHTTTNIPDPLTDVATNNSALEPPVKSEEPAAVETAPVSEIVSVLPTVSQQIEVPEIPIENETIERTIETTLKTPQIEELSVSTEVPETIENLQPEVIEPPPAPLPLKPSPDALLQRFNEKLGNRVVEGTGKGSVESLLRHDEQHSHHSHEHNSKDDHHAHEKNLAETQEKISPEMPIEKEKPDQSGFFGGLFKKFFSDADDSEQHFHTKNDNIFKPKKGKREPIQVHYFVVFT